VQNRAIWSSFTQIKISELGKFNETSWGGKGFFWFFTFMSIYPNVGYAVSEIGIFRYDPALYVARAPG